LDIEAAREGLSAVHRIISANACDVLVLDEVCIAIHYNLFESDELIDILQKRPPGMEVILTGRNAPEKLYDLADLVTEMKEVKHYYQQGIPARKGIEY
jgi:cob(I)alamin adenosyltransferase